MTQSSGADQASKTAKPPVAIEAVQAAPRTKPSNYPEPFFSRMAGRVKRPLGDLFGLSNFGVNLTRLVPGSQSALRHAHSRQDEFIYILEGEPTLITDAGETILRPGMCAGFRAGSGDAHHLVNRGKAPCVFVAVGRTAETDCHYPDIDMHLDAASGAFMHKDGTPY